VVVDAGLIFVDPLAAVDVNVPGVMAIVVAPVAVQLRVLLDPEFTVVGLAAKEVIVGWEPFPEDELAAPQFTNEMDASTMSASVPRFKPEALCLLEPNRFERDELSEVIRNPKRTQSIADAIGTVVVGGCSPLDHSAWFICRVWMCNST
jgi:hypothetical protein